MDCLRGGAVQSREELDASDRLDAAIQRASGCKQRRANHDVADARPKIYHRCARRKVLVQID